LDPRFAGSKAAEDNELSTVTKICATTSFGGEVKLSAHVVRFYGMLNNPAEYERGTSQAKFIVIARQVPPASLLDFSAGYCQRALVDESRVITTQIGMHIRLEIVSVLGTACTIPHRNSIC
jgi:hypothetical protein